MDRDAYFTGALGPIDPKSGYVEQLTSDNAVGNSDMAVQDTWRTAIPGNPKTQPSGAEAGPTYYDTLTQGGIDKNGNGGSGDITSDWQAESGDVNPGYWEGGQELVGQDLRGYVLNQPDVNNPVAWEGTHKGPHYRSRLRVISDPNTKGTGTRIPRGDSRGL